MPLLSTAVYSFPLLLLSAQPASPPAEAEPSTLSAIEIRQQRHDARRDDTAARIVVEREALLQFGDDTLADAMKRLPGVTVQAGAPGSGGRISLRGMGKGYTQILMDGQPVPADFDIGALSPERVARIEIQRAATADQRGEAIAGTINIVLRDDVAAQPMTFKVGMASSNGRLTPSLSWSGGHQGERYSSALQASANQRHFLVEERGVEQSTDARQVLRHTGMRFSGQRDAASLSPQLSWEGDGGDRLRWTIRWDRSRLQRTGDIDWNTLQGPPLTHARYRQQTRSAGGMLHSRLEWTHPLANDNQWTQSVTGTRLDDHIRFREQGWSTDGRPNLQDLTVVRIDGHTLGWQGKLDWRLGEKHALQAGGDLNRDQRRERREQWIQGEDIDVDAHSALAFDARVARAAFYLQDEWTLPQRWSLYAGARWESLQTRSVDRDGQWFRQHRSFTTPTLQARWKISPKREDRFRIALSRTFRAPTLGQLLPRPYTSTNNRPLNPDEQGNPALRAETALGLDVGLETEWGEGRSLNLGGYLRRIRDVIHSRTEEIGGRWVEIPFNSGHAQVRGLELDGKWRLPAQDIDLRFNLSRNHSRLTAVPGPDNRIDGQPRLTAGVGIDQRLSPRWKWGLSHTYRSADDFRASIREYSGQGAQHELDLYLEQRLSPAMRLRGSASNLLQRPRQDRAGFDGDGGSTSIWRERRMPMTLRLDWEATF